MTLYLTTNMSIYIFIIYNYEKCNNNMIINVYYYIITKYYASQK